MIDLEKTLRDLADEIKANKKPLTLATDDVNLMEAVVALENATEGRFVVRLELERPEGKPVRLGFEIYLNDSDAGNSFHNGKTVRVALNSALLQLQKESLRNEDKAPEDMDAAIDAAVAPLVEGAKTKLVGVTESDF
jgi:hypothetical protein